MHHDPNIMVKIAEYAAAHGVDPAIVYGICKRESGLDYLSVRYEPGYRLLYKPESVKPSQCSLMTEEALQRMSFGIMQVMGAVARELGFIGWLTEFAINVDEQLKFGCIHLSRMIDMHGLSAGISAYNAGTPRRTPAGDFVNQKYVDAVFAFAGEYNNLVTKSVS